MKTQIRLMLLAAAVALTACGPTAKPQDELAPEFEGGGQGDNIGDPLYPGPYGVNKGTVVRNYKFLGLPRASRDMSELKDIQLSDFYNPTGTAVFPEGSPYGAGEPKPLALVIVRSAVWCGPCNIEARDIIPGKRAAVAPQGEFFVVLDETRTVGEVATPHDINEWATNYNLNYPGAIDPSKSMDAITGVGVYPANVLIRTRDMKIVLQNGGAPDEAFWQTFQDVIEGKPVLPGDE